MGSNAHPMVDAAVNAVIDADVLGVLASVPTMEIDWRAEYARLYSTWRSAKNRLAELEDKHRFAKLATELSEKCGRSIDIRCEFNSNGTVILKAWIGYPNHGYTRVTTTFTPEFDSIEALEEYVLATYAPKAEPEVAAETVEDILAGPVPATVG